MICPKCSKNNQPGAKFCSFCGRELKKPKTFFSLKKFFILALIILLIYFTQNKRLERLNNYLSQLFKLSQPSKLSQLSQPSRLNYPSIEAQNTKCQFKQSVKAAEDCTVLILAWGKNFQSQGSGFLYQDKNLILTNRHVIANATKITIFDKGKNQYQAFLWNYSQDLDLAILKTEKNLPFSPCSINLDNIEKGENVVALGYPSTSKIQEIDYSDISYSKGTISRFAQYQNNYLIEFQATINPGNSGGPLVNACGIIGIVTARSVAPEVKNIGFAISSISINKQLPNLLVQKSPISIAPDFSYVTPSYSDEPPYSYYEQYNISEKTIQEATKLKETVAHLRQIWRQEDSSAFNKEKVDQIKDLLERMTNVTENILPKVINRQPLSQEEIRLINELSHMISLLNQYHRDLEVNFNGWDYYFYTCQNNVCQKKIGLGKDQCQSSWDCQPKYHYQCVNLSCQLVEGEGEDTCSSSFDCYHYTCQEGQCIKVEGKGENQCYSDWSCYHYECQDKKCVRVNTPGTNQCYSDFYCQ